MRGRLGGGIAASAAAAGPYDDSLTGGVALTFTAVLLYFGSLVLEGVFSSAQETLLVIFGQKMTHALRAEMSQKLTLLPASTLAAQIQVKLPHAFQEM